MDRILISLDSKSAVGCDGIPTSFLKLARPIVVPMITYLFNLCFECGVFPDVLKKAIITPVYKSGDRDDMGNYRPISVLPAISKILEKLINNRILSYLAKYDILSSSQYGFRKNVSTVDAVLAVSGLLVNKLDSGKKCLTVFIDLKKAFDTVSVPTLVQKLENAGFRGTSLALMKSYLSNRRQGVKVG